MKLDTGPDRTHTLPSMNVAATISRSINTARKVALNVSLANLLLALALVLLNSTTGVQT